MENNFKKGFSRQNNYRHANYSHQSKCGRPNYKKNYRAKNIMDWQQPTNGHGYRKSMKRQHISNENSRHPAFLNRKIDEQYYDPPFGNHSEPHNRNQDIHRLWGFNGPTNNTVRAPPPCMSKIVRPVNVVKDNITVPATESQKFYVERNSINNTTDSDLRRPKLSATSGNANPLETRIYPARHFPTVTNTLTRTVPPLNCSLQSPSLLKRQSCQKSNSKLSNRTLDNMRKLLMLETLCAKVKKMRRHSWELTSKNKACFDENLNAQQQFCSYLDSGTINVDVGFLSTTSTGFLASESFTDGNVIHHPYLSTSCPILPNAYQPQGINLLNATEGIGLVKLTKPLTILKPTVTTTKETKFHFEKSPSCQPIGTQRPTKSRQCLQILESTDNYKSMVENLYTSGLCNDITVKKKCIFNYGSQRMPTTANDTSSESEHQAALSEHATVLINNDQDTDDFSGTNSTSHETSSIENSSSDDLNSINSNSNTPTESPEPKSNSQIDGEFEISDLKACLITAISPIQLV